MKEKEAALKIYNFSQPLIYTEWLSIQSDKFSHSLPFEWEIVSDYASSDVVVWDGIITPKNNKITSAMVKDFKDSKILLLFGESMTLFRNHPLVKMLNPEGLRYVEVSGWNILPEDILAALELCREKLKNV
jgi:hypothetical protein